MRFRGNGRKVAHMLIVRLSFHFTSYGARSAGPEQGGRHTHSLALSRTASSTSEKRRRRRCDEGKVLPSRP
jgi:hypothetical protein